MLILMLISTETSSLKLTSPHNTKNVHVNERVNKHKKHLYSKPNNVRLYEINLELLKNNIDDYLGVPYKNDTSGVDCSELTMTIFRNFNIKIPRTSYDQCNIGKPVHINNTRIGDLIFFGGKKINHVGIVISNNENCIEFIHASKSANKVIKTKLSAYYFKNYKKIIVKRILK